MEAIILAGGFGKRLRPIVSDVPKPMARIGKIPFLEILLKYLARNKFTSITLSVGYKYNIIKNHFNYKFENMQIKYSIEKQPLGTGGAIKKAMKMCENDHTFVFNGDTLLEVNIDKAWRTWKKKKNNTIICRKVEDTSDFGKLIILNNKVIGFEEKSSKGPGYVNAGCYIFNVDIFDDYKEKKIFSIEKDFFPSFLKEQGMEFFESDGIFIDIGTISSYNLINKNIKIFKKFLNF